PATGPSTARPAAPPGRKTTASAPARACPPAASCPCASFLRSQTPKLVMASATETPPASAEATSPIARALKEELGDQVLKVDEFRGDLAVTVSPQGWVRAATALKS